MTYAAEIVEFIRSHATSNRPPAGYTGSTHKHYGLSAPVMRDFVRRWTKQHETRLTFASWLATLDDLYAGESLEEKSITGLLIAAFPAFRKQLPLEKLYDWLGQLEGWTEIDSTCQSSFTAREVFIRWEDWQALLRRLAVDESISRRRAALVLLVRPLRESDNPRMLRLALEQVEALKSEKDRLITKAVSWLLRSGIKYHALAIRHYIEVNADALPRLALREVRAKLATGKK